MSIQVSIVAYPGALASAVTGLLEILRTANAASGRDLFDVTLRSTSDAPVRTWSGLELHACATLPRRPQALILVPGIGLEDPSLAVEKLRALAQAAPRVGTWILRQHEAGAVVGSTCAASLILAQLGMLDGRAATTTWWLAEAFRESFPQVDLRPEEMLVDDGDVMTTGAAMSHLDLGLHVIKRFVDPKLAARCAKLLVLDGVRRSQAGYVIPAFVRSQDPLVAEAAAALRRTPRAGERPRSVSQIAAQLGVSPRTLARRFERALHQSPRQYRLARNMERARELLEQGKLNVAQVAERLGYADTSSFYRAFRKATGLAPRDYAARFSR